MYPLTCKVQNYLWGKKGVSGKVGKISALQQGFYPCSNSLAINEKIQSMEDTNFAQLWMGAHTNGSSIIKHPKGGQLSLIQYIELMPKEALGMKLMDAQFSQLPFLFKVLSVGSPLSIQIHPDKENAKVLHQQHPQIYKDANHKPEIAIALTDLDLLYGFKGESQFQQLILRNQALGGLIKEIEEYKKQQQKDQAKLGSNDSSTEHSKRIRDFVKYIFLNKEDKAKCQKIESITQQLISDLSMKNEKGQILAKQELLAIEVAKSQFDAQGILFLILMNHLTVSAGEAIFIRPGVPHAYLSGDLMQCMASSDNVLRAGLTVKLKDYQNFCKIVETQQSDIENVIFKGQKVGQGCVQLFHSNDDRYQQFAVFKVRMEEEGKLYNLNHKFLKQSPKILICIKGEVWISQKSQKSQDVNMKQGDVIFITAQIDELQLGTKLSGSQIYLASCGLK